MFDLETTIAEWRQQMLAAGILAPVPLEELELHLREEIYQQIRLGHSGVEAFNSAVQKIGQPESLKREFKKSIGFIEFLHRHRIFKLNCWLGLIWFVFYGKGILETGARAFRGVHDFMALVSVLIFCSGMFGSVLLIFGSKWGRRITRTNALLFVVWSILLYAASVGSFGSNLSFWSVITLCVVSILTLHRPICTGPEVAK